MREFRRQSDCVYDCTYHLVLPTKYRKKIFNEGTFAFFKERMRDTGALPRDLDKGTKSRPRPCTPNADVPT